MVSLVANWQAVVISQSVVIFQAVVIWLAVEFLMVRLFTFP